jgi:hypothetical protein
MRLATRLFGFSSGATKVTKKSRSSSTHSFYGLKNGPSRSRIGRYSEVWRVALTERNRSRSGRFGYLEQLADLHGHINQECWMCCRFRLCPDTHIAYPAWQSGEVIVRQLLTVGKRRRGNRHSSYVQLRDADAVSVSRVPQTDQSILNFEHSHQGLYIPRLEAITIPKVREDRGQGCVRRYPRFQFRESCKCLLIAGKVTPRGRKPQVEDESLNK